MKDYDENYSTGFDPDQSSDQTDVDFPLRGLCPPPGFKSDQFSNQTDEGFQQPWECPPPGELAHELVYGKNSLRIEDNASLMYEQLVLGQVFIEFDYDKYYNLVPRYLWGMGVPGILYIHSFEHSTSTESVVSPYMAYNLACQHAEQWFVEMFRDYIPRHLIFYDRGQSTLNIKTHEIGDALSFAESHLPPHNCFSFTDKRRIIHPT